MKIINRFVAALAAVTLFAGQAYSQEFVDGGVSPAYEDSNYWSAALPIGALVIAGVIIATTDRHHHHSSGGARRRSSSSSSHHHSHSSSGCL